MRLKFIFLTRWSTGVLFRHVWRSQFHEKSQQNIFPFFFHFFMKPRPLLFVKLFSLVILTFKSLKSIKKHQSYATFLFASKILVCKESYANVTQTLNSGKFREIAQLLTFIFLTRWSTGVLFRHVWRSQFHEKSQQNIFPFFFHFFMKPRPLLFVKLFSLVILTFKSLKSIKKHQSYATFLFASKILVQYVKKVTRTLRKRYANAKFWMHLLRPIRQGDIQF